jgi:hypothetical protein
MVFVFGKNKMWFFQLERTYCLPKEKSTYYISKSDFYSTLKKMCDFFSKQVKIRRKTIKIHSVCLKKS